MTKFLVNFNDYYYCNFITEFNTIVKSRYKMLSYAGYVDPESTLAIGVHHDGHLEATERNFCSLYHTFMFGSTLLPTTPHGSI